MAINPSFSEPCSGRDRRDLPVLFAGKILFFSSSSGDFGPGRFLDALNRHPVTSGGVLPGKVVKKDLLQDTNVSWRTQRCLFIGSVMGFLRVECFDSIL